MKYLAYAKINLRLEVEGKLSNGYHKLNMVNAKVSLADELEISTSTYNQVTFSDPSLNEMKNNMCLDILNEICSLKNIDQRFHIYIKKNIPQGAGLGGGSSDAAAIINFINEHCKLNMSDEEKISIAVKYGADIPYCLFNDISFVSGIGEKITPLNIKLKQRVVLIYPNIFIQTKQIFERVKTYTSPTKLEDIYNYLNEGSYNKLLYNDLEQPAFLLNNKLSKLKNELSNYGIVSMSGSGSTLILIPNNNEVISEIKNKYKDYLVFETEII